MRRTIHQRGLLERGQRVVVACSGGPDSAALLAVLARLAPELDITLYAASVDHGLRPDASCDVDIARRQARALGVAFQALSASPARRPSLQAAARAARYRALLEWAGELGACRVAVGHTRDDQAETVLMRLLRGSGLAGLAGIEPLRADGVVRPLIDCRRADAHALARATFTQLAADPSNRDARFERTRIRERLLPVMHSEDAAVVEHLAALADDARANRRALARQAERLLSAAGQHPRSIRVSVLRGADGASRRHALARWVQQHTGQPAGRAHLEQLDHAVGAGGEIWLPGGWVAKVGPDGLMRLSHREPAAP